IRGAGGETGRIDERHSIVAGDDQQPPIVGKDHAVRAPLERDHPREGQLSAHTADHSDATFRGARLRGSAWISGFNGNDEGNKHVASVSRWNGLEWIPRDLDHRHRFHSGLLASSRTVWPRRWRTGK